ncbi:MAG TPA: thymidine phosphorylase, partial [Clostridia bacterium]|nr:thymidine phosphorylase [Clostridia bacterium]
MTAYDIIEKKRYGKELTDEEINFFINGYTLNQIPDYQMSALLMAICCNGMNENETFALTNCMLHSGDVVDMSKIDGIVVDKHSTGGVGDTTTLILAPLLACCGVKVAKMSGRGLGFTGGTIDKLESIPGFNTSLSEEKFFDIVNKIGCCVIGQTENLAPADKKLYALRDVTATIDSIPLICGSIMSKKLASGAEAVLLDVKYGDGAFMKTKERAVELAKIMVKIGNRAGKKFAALVTDMSEPLATKVGNSLEIIGAIEVMKGKHNRLREEMCLVAERLLVLSGKFDTKSAQKNIENVLADGSVLKKFKEMVEAQGGNPVFIDHPEKFVLGETVDVLAQKDGYVFSMRAEELGKAVTLLGGGRMVKSDVVD